MARFGRDKDSNLRSASLRYSRELSAAITRHFRRLGLKGLVPYALGSLAHGTAVAPVHGAMTLQPPGSDVELFCVVPEQEEARARAALSSFDRLLSKAGLRLDTSLLHTMRSPAFVFTPEQLLAHIERLRDPAFIGISGGAHLLARPLSTSPSHRPIQRLVEQALERLARSPVPANSLRTYVAAHAKQQREKGTSDLCQQNIMVSAGSLARGEKAMAPVGLFPDICTVKEAVSLLAVSASHRRGSRPRSYRHPLRRTNDYWRDIFAHISRSTRGGKLVSRRQWQDLERAADMYQASRARCRESLAVTEDPFQRAQTAQPVLQRVLDVRRVVLQRLEPTRPAATPKNH